MSPWNRDSVGGNFPQWTTTSYTHFAQSSVNFDGIDDYIALGDIPDMETNTGTVSAWISPTDTSAFKVVFSSGHNSINTKYLMLGLGSDEKASIYAYLTETRRSGKHLKSMLDGVIRAAKVAEQLDLDSAPKEVEVKGAGAATRAHLTAV